MVFSSKSVEIVIVPKNLVCSTNSENQWSKLHLEVNVNVHRKVWHDVLRLVGDHPLFSCVLTCWMQGRELTELLK